MGQIAPTLDADFKRRVANLVAKRKEADRSFKEALGTYLDFCREYFRVSKEARTSAAREYLQEQTGIDEATVRSRYNLIGAQYGVLKKHVAFLPPSQESLKELARAEKKRQGTIDRLVQRDLLTPESSVSEVRAHVRKLAPSRRDSGDSVQQSVRHYEVTLSCSNRQELVGAVVALLRDSANIVATVEGRALHADLKSTLGQWWKSNEARLVLSR